MGRAQRRPRGRLAAERPPRRRFYTGGTERATKLATPLRAGVVHLAAPMGFTAVCEGLAGGGGCGSAAGSSAAAWHAAATDFGSRRRCTASRTRRDVIAASASVGRTSAVQAGDASK